MRAHSPFGHLHAACATLSMLSFAVLLSSAVLEALDLRDNQLKALPSLAAFTSLRYLEVSYNEVCMAGSMREATPARPWPD